MADKELTTAKILKIERIPDAAGANAQEHELTFWQAFRLYYKGVFWSLIISTVIIMEGYDTKLMGTLFAQPNFREHYGNRVKDDKFEISAPWQAGLVNGSAVGQFAGLVVAGYLTERFGFRKTMLAGQLAIVGCIFIQVFSTSLPVLEVAQILFGEFLCGVTDSEGVG